MNLIVAVDENWGIGKDGDLLEKISEDLKYFKQKTTGKTVVMGRVTFDSLPNRKPLPNRKNIVLSRSEEINAEGITLCRSVEELQKEIESEESDNIFVMGGAKIYELLLPYCKKAYITKIYKKYEADRHFKNLDDESSWKITEKSEMMYKNEEIPFQFLVYERV